MGKWLGFLSDSWFSQIECKNEENVLAHTLYNDVKITAIIKSKNAYGCQFHPEKSGEYGLKLLGEFIQL